MRGQRTPVQTTRRQYLPDDPIDVYPNAIELSISTPLDTRRALPQRISP